MNRDHVTSAGRPARQILILRPGAIGDTLLTFPSFALLRRGFPDARITAVGNRAALSLALNAGLVDAIDAFGADWVADLFGDKPTPALRQRLECYDLGVVWMHSSEAANDLARRLEGAGVRRAVPLVGFPEAGSQRHVADHLIDTLSMVGCGEGRPSVRGKPRLSEDGYDPIPLQEGGEIGRRMTLTLSREVRGKEGGVAGSSSAPLVVLHPGAGARRKRWSADKYAALGERFMSRGFRLAMSCGPADEDAVAALQAALLTPAWILTGFDLADLAAILSQASLVVGNDSGVTHLAALVGAPTLALFGPFDPAYWSPIGPHVAVVDAGRACTHRQDPRDGCRQCDLLSSLDVDPVWEAGVALLRVSGAD